MYCLRRAPSGAQRGARGLENNPRIIFWEGCWDYKYGLYGLKLDYRLFWIMDCPTLVCVCVCVCVCVSCNAPPPGVPAVHTVKISGSGFGKNSGPNPRSFPKIINKTPGPKNWGGKIWPKNVSSHHFFVFTPPFSALLCSF